MSKSIIIIPSRLAATRLPNKPLLNINKKPLIMHVYEKVIKSKVEEVYVATCEDEIATEVGNNGGNFIMTDPKHASGTDRVYEAAQKLKLKDDDIIINVQGDEPMINPYDIDNLNKISKLNNLNFSTLAYKIQNKVDYINKDIVKVVTQKKISNKEPQKALSFNRKISHDNKNYIYQHFGIYLYKVSILKKFVSLKQTKKENSEKLEQLRAIENNIKIDVILAKYFSSGIDTKKDLDEYIKLLNK